jgi:orotidine-5'-phosphate decarboxylase
MSHNPIITALDTNDLAHATELAKLLKDDVAAIKLGLEFFCIHGPKGVEAVADTGVKIFLDLKFYDIPNTVAGAIRSIAPLNVFMTTLHAGGGFEMMTRAKTELVNAEVDTMLLGVTVLTSFSDIKEIGVEKPIGEQVVNLAALAAGAHLDGVVCSPHEIKFLKERFGNKLKLIVPGIRPVGSSLNDQKRTMTPREALANGADYLVIGRPITDSKDPSETVKAILASF